VLIREVASTYTFIRVRGVALADNRLAVDRMTREIRQIASATTIYVADAEKIDFGKIDGEKVIFEKSGIDLLRNTDKLATDVTLFDLVYYDIANNPLDRPVVDPSSIWRILIKLTIKKGDQTVKFQSQVHPRNL